MSPLLAEILDEIDRKGAILFSRFMDLCLYHPRFGYYEKHLDQVGKGGDFATNVSCGDLFGCLLAEQFADWSKPFLSSKKPFMWIEAGAHDGRLAKDILNHCRSNLPEHYDRLSYVILEPSPARARIQKKILDKHPRVQWLSSWESLPAKSIEGIVFCNELLDAFPVERISWDVISGEWFAWEVANQNGKLCWHRSQNHHQNVLDFSRKIPSQIRQHLPNGFTTEVSSKACDWWNAAARRIRRGYLFAIDYGFTFEERFAAHRRQGTLRAYTQHRLSNDLLKNPGEQDITAHVDFTAIQQAGYEAGLIDACFQSQEQFLGNITKRILKNSPQSLALISRRRQLQTLIHPNHFGHAFSVLAQKVGIHL